MRKLFTRIAAVTLLGVALAAALTPAAHAGDQAADQACQSAGPATAIAAVRARRAAFNAAIVEKDLPAMAATMHEHIILLTGTASEVFTGRAAQLALWQEDFETPGRAVYVRTTNCVRVSEAFPVALENGHWRGVREGSTEDFAAGAYAAKWRRVDGSWLLEAEIFSTEDCGGDFCPVSVAEAP